MPAATVAFSSPFVPAEWIAAHGLTPLRLVPGPSCVAAGAGVCPFAHDFLHAVTRAGVADAVIFTGTCDQMRRTAAQAAMHMPTFLMHVPATWQDASASDLYIAELQRMSGFLLSAGGSRPSQEHLKATMLAGSVQRPADDGCLAAFSGIRLAVAGGPLRRQDAWIRHHIETHGGTVVLDATESGARSLAAPFEEAAVRVDPLRELARAYFLGIPDAFRRPDSLLHDYLRREVQSRRVQGLLMIRYVWCDQWRAQTARLKAELGIKVVEIDLAQDDADLPRNATRIESLLDMLR